MNIYLAELINSVPPEFSVKEQNKGSIRFHHKNKGIYISWFSNGQPCIISYYENGQRHRPSSEGPAYQEWNKDGSSYSEEYWENGQEVKSLT